jgi:hypothetical protein
MTKADQIAELKKVIAIYEKTANEMRALYHAGCDAGCEATKAAAIQWAKANEINLEKSRKELRDLNK